MPKFYIQSGNVSYTVNACDAEGAALWAMHRTMDEKICDYEDGIMQQTAEPFNIPVDDTDIDGVPAAIPYEAMLNGLAMFEETIYISERGHGRSESGSPATEDIFHQWRQLMQAVDRLHDRLN